MLNFVPAWLWLTSPLKWALWVVNRAATWTGSFLFWRRFRSQRLVLMWITLINAASFGALALLLFWLHEKGR